MGVAKAPANPTKASICLSGKQCQQRRQGAYQRHQHEGCQRRDHRVEFECGEDGQVEHRHAGTLQQIRVTAACCHLFADVANRDAAGQPEALHQERNAHNADSCRRNSGEQGVVRRPLGEERQPDEEHNRADARHRVAAEQPGLGATNQFSTGSGSRDRSGSGGRCADWGTQWHWRLPSLRLRYLRRSLRLNWSDWRPGCQRWRLSCPSSRATGVGEGASEVGSDFSGGVGNAAGIAVSAHPARTLAPVSAWQTDPASRANSLRTDLRSVSPISAPIRPPAINVHASSWRGRMMPSIAPQIAPQITIAFPDPSWINNEIAGAYLWSPRAASVSANVALLILAVTSAQRVKELAHHARAFVQRGHWAFDPDLVLAVQAIAAVFLDQLDQFDRLERGLWLEGDDGALGCAIDLLDTQRLARDAQLMCREQ